MRPFFTDVLKGLFAAAVLMAGVVVGTDLTHTRPADAQTINTYATPVVTATAVASLVLKAGPGNLYSVYATNNTSSAGFLVVINKTSDPTSGTITPLDCVPLPGNGAASINYVPTPPGHYSVGITAILTSASSCYTVTEGTITGFIHGSVQ